MVPASDQWIWRCDRVIPSDAAVGRGILHEVLSQLESQHWQQQDIFAVHLAMEEAMANAIQHGNRSDTQKQVHVSCCVAPDRVCIEIIDEGRGFDPHAVPDPTCLDRIHSPRGRGVMLMKAFMSRVEYNPSGNGVLLEKHRAKAE